MRWLLIDRLEECQPGERAVAIKVFPRSDLLFMDHFPGNEMVPGVIEIEMIAQTAALCLRAWRPAFGVLSRINSARFIKPIRPGDQCRVTAVLTRTRPHYVLASGYIEVDGKKVGEAEFTVAILPDHEFHGKDPLLEQWARRKENDAVIETRAVLSGDFKDEACTTLSLY